MARAGSDDLYTRTGTDLSARIRRRELSPVAILDALFARIERIDAELHAYCHLDREAAYAAADAAEKALDGSAPLGPLHGVPVSVKDLVAAKAMPFSRGSVYFKDEVPDEDAPSVERLRRAGAIIVGKTNTPEFGWKGVTSNLIYPETRNPWDLTRTPGGSSGGAAAAVAAGLGPLAVGSDGGGSIRIPSFFCGLYGLKASAGRIPVYPASPVGTLSHVGPMTRTVADAALMYRVMAGPDERDPYSLPPAATPNGELVPLEGVRIGWSPDLGFMDVDPEVADICERAVRKLAGARCEVVPLKVDIGDPTPTVAAHFRLGIGGAVTSLPDWESKLDPGLVDLVRHGGSLSPYDFGRAALGRAAVWERLRRVMAEVDFLATPTLPLTAFPLGRDYPEAWHNKEDGPLRWIGLTSTFNLTGQPAATLPCGFDSNGLPVGLQIVGRRFADWDVLRLSRTFEEIAPWHEAWPAIAAS